MKSRPLPKKSHTVRSRYATAPSQPDRLVRMWLYGLISLSPLLLQLESPCGGDIHIYIYIATSVTKQI